MQREREHDAAAANEFGGLLVASNPVQKSRNRFAAHASGVGIGKTFATFRVIRWRPNHRHEHAVTFKTEGVASSQAERFRIVRGVAHFGWLDEAGEHDALETKAHFAPAAASHDAPTVPAA